MRRQDIKLLEVLAERVREDQREEAERQRMLGKWEEERRRGREEKAEEERLVAKLGRERRTREEEDARRSLEKAREAFLQVPE